MWREYIQGLTAPNSDSICILATGATPAAIEKVESQLHIELPPSLRELLQETNGVVWRISLSDGEEIDLALVWSTEELIGNNQHLCTSKQNPVPDSFRDLLFFGDEGNGDYFSFALTTSRKAVGEEILDWSHETGQRKRLSPSLRELLGVLGRL